MKNKKRAILLILVIFFLLISITIRCHLVPLPSQFSTKGSSESLMNIRTWDNNGTTICAANGIQKNPQICSDGAGGAIITWQDHRNGTISEIYAQRITATGDVLWTANGIATATMDYDQINPQICSDGVGGAIIIWRIFYIYAQRINATGALLWAKNGTSVCGLYAAEVNPQICSDGLGGAIIVWQELRSPPMMYYEIYAQRLNASGAHLWTENGTAVRTATTNHHMNPQLCSDGAGGAIITWDEYRQLSHGHVYAQRINATGAVSWTAAGVAICTLGFDEKFPQLCSDGVGGAIIAWQDDRVLSEIYAQRITAAGAVSWTANGIAICTTFTSSQRPQICSDSAGGAIITWVTMRPLTKWDIDAQRINATGTVLWPVNGIPICTASATQNSTKICSDNASGAIITWADYRTGSNSDIYAQRITPAGAFSWTLNGTAVSTASGVQSLPVICGYGIGGAIISWMDRRSGVFDIYANKIGEPQNAPHLETLNAIGKTILLNWTAISDATIYYIYRNTSEITSISGLICLKAVSSNYTTDEIQVAQTYYYVIVAGNLYGNSTISNCQNITIIDEGDGIPGFELLPSLITFLLLISVLPIFKFSRPPKYIHNRVLSVNRELKF